MKIGFFETIEDFDALPDAGAGFVVGIGPIAKDFHATLQRSSPAYGSTCLTERRDIVKDANGGAQSSDIVHLADSVPASRLHAVSGLELAPLRQCAQAERECSMRAGSA